MTPNLIFIEHILQNIKKVESFSKGLERNELEENELKQYALVRAIEVIGEAAKNMPAEFKSRYPLIPWKNIIGTRDIMIHRYFGVDLDVLWSIIKQDLPKLKEQIKEILEMENSSSKDLGGRK